MQKIINVMAVLSFGVSTAVVVGGVYGYTQRDTIESQVRDKITEAIKGALSGSQLGTVLMGGSGDVSDTDLDVPGNPPISLPVSPF